MPMNRQSVGRMRVTEVEEFLREPPPGFSVEPLGSGLRVRSSEEKILVLIDDFESSGKKIVFQNSRGRKVKMRNLWDYSSMRKSLLSKKFYLLISACEDEISESNKKAARELRVLRQYVVCIDGSDPFIKWQLERGMDGTISSVAGESYRVDIDLTEEMESWAATSLLSGNLMKVKPVWRDASFTLKYYSDALFDFPHWLGFSRRKFKLRMTRATGGWRSRQS